MSALFLVESTKRIMRCHLAQVEDCRRICDLLRSDKETIDFTYFSSILLSPGTGERIDLPNQITLDSEPTSLCEKALDTYANTVSSYDKEKEEFEKFLMEQEKLKVYLVNKMEST